MRSNFTNWTILRIDHVRIFSGHNLCGIERYHTVENWKWIQTSRPTSIKLIDPQTKKSTNQKTIRLSNPQTEWKFLIFYSFDFAASQHYSFCQCLHFFAEFVFYTVPVQFVPVSNLWSSCSVHRKRGRFEKFSKCDLLLQTFNNVHLRICIQRFFVFDRHWKSLCHNLLQNVRRNWTALLSNQFDFNLDRRLFSYRTTISLDHV